ncbi:hypothetical protein K435DRAFT_727849 [Dendrothele bispora CBS 962.96]|uniref:Transmembrane protein n=1 Tax=Dendrothele bispora (strain CBS 962.96) TaxID=1314807 RepID=A0A4S8LPP8_DENBC|nr:hypothetical protein K435DRAFT_727849 [Dendrothele bispora CBS 962.96]
MVYWQSPVTLADNTLSFDKFLHVILGIYLWEFFTTFDFDWMFITRQKRFRWSLILYFYGRYAMLITLIGYIIALDVRDPVNCQALYQVLQVIGNSALGVATINFAIHTGSIWNQDQYIILGLGLLIAGQFGIIIRSMFNVKAAFVPRTGCTMVSIETTIFAAMYICTAVVVFVTLVLTGYKLTFPKTGSRSGLLKLLFIDGLFFFLVAIIGNIVAVVFSLLNLNPIMSIIANIPAITFSTIAAGRVIRSMHNYTSNSGDTPYPVLTATPAVSAAVFNTNRIGVRVEMATYTHADNEVYDDQTASTPNLERQKELAGDSDDYKPTTL